MTETWLMIIVICSVAGLLLLVQIAGELKSIWKKSLEVESHLFFIKHYVDDLRNREGE